MPALLEIHSGPHDGLRKTWPEHPEVRLHKTQGPQVFLIIDYDPAFPTEGVVLRLQETQGGVEVQVGTVSSFRRFGEVFQVGQTWLCVRKEA